MKSDSRQLHFQRTSLSDGLCLGGSFLQKSASKSQSKRIALRLLKNPPFLRPYALHQSFKASPSIFTFATKCRLNIAQVRLTAMRLRHGLSLFPSRTAKFGGDVGSASGCIRFCESWFNDRWGLIVVGHFEEWFAVFSREVLNSSKQETIGAIPNTAFQY